VFAEMFKPQTPAYAEMWLGDKADKVTLEYWREDIQGYDIPKLTLRDTGTGIITKDPVSG
jgi:hypothetical protein